MDAPSSLPLQGASTLLMQESTFLRIISGLHRGRQLKSPSSSKIRPTSDRIRESLFSILGSVQDCVVIDGFAGSGALGCEALSRGAKHVFFFDSSSEAIRLVQANVELIRSPHKVTIKKVPCARGIRDMVSMVPDLVFLDPPYGKPQLIQEALVALAASPLTQEGALIVVEQESDDALPELMWPFEFDEERVYGRTKLVFLRVISGTSEVES